MTIVAIVILALKVSVALLVFALGLKTDVSAFTYLAQRPLVLLRSLLAMNILLPLFVAALALIFPFRSAVEIIVVALALSPVPPLLWRKQTKKGGSESYAAGLLVASGLVAIVSIPLMLEVIERLFGVPLDLPLLAVAQIMLMTIFLPLAAGAVIRAVLPKLAAWGAGPISAIAGIVLPLAGVALVILAWPQVVAQLGDGTVLFLVAFVVAGLAVGHFLGGPAPEDRTVLAFAAASRHPGMALAIVSANFPEEKTVVGVVVLYLLVSGVLTVGYLQLRKALGKRAAELAPL